MRRLRALLVRLAGLFGRKRHDREFGAELQEHVQAHIEDNLRAGMPPDVARHDALLKLGGIDATLEQYRDQHGFPVLESVRQDLRY